MDRTTLSIWSRDLAIVRQLTKVEVSEITHDNRYTYTHVRQ